MTIGESLIFAWKNQDLKVGILKKLWLDDFCVGYAHCFLETYQAADIFRYHFHISLK
jgi:hypothetical protein